MFKKQKRIASPKEDPVMFMSRSKLIKEIKKLRKRNHEIASQWSKRYGQVVQDLIHKKMILSVYEDLSKKGLDHLKAHTTGRPKYNWSLTTQRSVGMLIEEVETLLGMLRTKDELLKSGRQVVAKLKLHKNCSEEESNAIDWLVATAPYSRPVFDDDYRPASLR